MAKKAQQARCSKCIYNDGGKGCDLNNDAYMTAQSFNCKDYDRDKTQERAEGVVKLEPQKQKPRVKVFNSDEVCYRFYE